MHFLYLSVTPSKEGSFTEPPASPRPATGRLYDQPANCCCIVWESIGPSTYESVGASEVNSRSKLAVSFASSCTGVSRLYGFISTKYTYYIGFEARLIFSFQEFSPV